MEKVYPAIDLHLHLDGSLSVKTIKHLALINNMPVLKDKEISKLVEAPVPCHSLEEYLSVFDYPISLLQTKESLEYAFFSLGEELFEKGLIYAEIRFAPLLHLKKGLTPDEVVEASIEGMKKSRLKTNLILCCMRHFSLKENLITVELAKQYYGRGVVALDLAGGEAAFPTRIFKPIFDLAKQYNIPFTIHAGEGDSSRSVKEALDLGAVRIGHGVRSIEDHNVLKMLADRHILLEICPKSEVQTKAISFIKALPINTFRKENIPFTICSDDMAVSSTDVQQEILLVKEVFDLKEDDIQKTILDGIKYSFASKEDKKTLSNLVNNYFKDLK